MSYRDVNECMKAAEEQMDALVNAYADGKLEEYVDEEFLRENMVIAKYDLGRPGVKRFTNFDLDNLNGLHVSYKHIEVVGMDGSHYECYPGDPDSAEEEVMNALFDYIKWVFNDREDE